MVCTVYFPKASHLSLHIEQKYFQKWFSGRLCLCNPLLSPELKLRGNGVPTFSRGKGVLGDLEGTLMVMKLSSLFATI